MRRVFPRRGTHRETNVIKTLHTYLIRELLKLTGLALVAFTVLMTVLAVIEPLRKRGLSPGQVVAFFGYMLPVMFSLTLPIAVLFATTMVYGRFSQDNELTACRASGISTLSILAPAVLLGGAVTVATAGLNNYISPRMMAVGERAIKSNVRNLVYHPIKAWGYVSVGNYILHADDVLIETENPREMTLRGMVVIDKEDRAEVGMISASTAYVNLKQYHGDTYASIYPLNSVANMGRVAFQQTLADLESLRLPSLTSENPNWYDWSRLVEVYRDPTKHAGTARRLEEIARKIRHDMLAHDLVETINNGEKYGKLHKDDQTFVIEAPRADIGQTGQAELSWRPPRDDGSARLVRVAVTGPHGVRLRLTARRAMVTAKWSVMSETSNVTIRLWDNVKSVGPDGVLVERKQWESGSIPLPDHVIAATKDIDPTRLYRNPQQLNISSDTMADIEKLRTGEIAKLKNRIIAEMNTRFAYSISCLLLVGIGAAIGLIFRGGQVISAFALSVIPAAVVIIMIIMGKEMVKNPDVSSAAGIMVIWSGIVALAAAMTWLYAKLARQ